MIFMETIRTDQIQKIISMLKIQVSDLEDFKDKIDLIIDMFNKIKGAQIQGSTGIIRKKISIKDLREDTPHLNTDLQSIKGQYIIVPPVSTK